MNQYNASRHSLSELRVARRLSLWVNLLLRHDILLPLAGPASIKILSSTQPRAYFDYYEVAFVLFLPLVYLVFGVHICTVQASLLRHSAGQFVVRRLLTRYKLTYMLARFLLCFYQGLITIVLSPGGPDELRGTFWLCTVIFYPLYLALVMASQLFIRMAIEMAQRARAPSLCCHGRPSAF